MIFSHSSARAVCDSPRNVPDDVLARLPGNGGVCMVTFVPGFVSQECADWLAALKAEAAGRGLEDVSAYPALFADLLSRGWTGSDCAAVAGGNLLRALRTAESAASGS